MHISDLKKLFIGAVIAVGFLTFVNPPLSNNIYAETWHRFLGIKTFVVNNENLIQDAGNIVAQVAPAVVSVNAYKNISTYSFQFNINGFIVDIDRIFGGEVLEEISSGSGFFVSDNGYIVTNKHVVSDNFATYRVDYNGSEVDAEVVYRDSDYDLAILKIDGTDFPTVSLGNSSDVSVGENVITIGNALGKYEDYATEGAITAFGRDISVDMENGGTEILRNLIETSAQLYPGSSGGPLLDFTGQVLGINTAMAVGENVSLGYAIPVEVVKEVISRAGIEL